MELDSAKAERTDPENLVRLIRALEVCQITGRPMSELERVTHPLDVPVIKIGLHRIRRDLYRIIDCRVDRMMQSGLLDEVRQLVAVGYGDTPVVKHCLGYRELLEYLEGSTTLDDAVRLIKRRTRNLAKRQVTWFRKEGKVTWLNLTGSNDYRRVAEQIASLIRKQGRT